VSKIIILGSGAAPGVPSLACGFGDCDPKNPKNYRSRSGTYIELSGVKFLIDTSPDLRLQLINSNIKSVDAVFYTHEHADHLHGIDDLREINRISKQAIELFASKKNLDAIRTRFGYLIAEDATKINPLYRAALHPNTFNHEESFYYKDLKITPIKLLGHNVESTGYIFNDGEVVFIADFREIPEKALSLIKKKPEVLIMPLTTIKGTRFHASLNTLLDYHEIIAPKKMIINHMAVESDYNEVYSNCPPNVEPAFDGLEINW
jgi:phosphoribosyl 1,2-cyclic phosphate phosphodiesterase